MFLHLPGFKEFTGKRMELLLALSSCIVQCKNGIRAKVAKLLAEKGCKCCCFSGERL